MLLTNSDLSEQVTAIKKQHFRAKCGHSEEATVESHVLGGSVSPHLTHLQITACPPSGVV